jgi:hypothetical protein
LGFGFVTGADFGEGFFGFGIGKGAGLTIAFCFGCASLRAIATTLWLAARLAQALVILLVYRPDLTRHV